MIIVDYWFLTAHSEYEYCVRYNKVKLPHANEIEAFTEATVSRVGILLLELPRLGFQAAPLNLPYWNL